MLKLNTTLYHYRLTLVQKVHFQFKVLLLTVITLSEMMYFKRFPIQAKEKVTFD